MAEWFLSESNELAHSLCLLFRASLRKIYGFWLSFLVPTTRNKDFLCQNKKFLTDSEASRIETEPPNIF